jgi:hypothetical protein
MAALPSIVLFGSAVLALIIVGFVVVYAVGICRRSMGFKREAAANVPYAVARRLTLQPGPP